MCGSRGWGDDRIVHALLTGLYREDTVGHLAVQVARFAVIEGHCPTGADRAARWWAENSPFHSHNERPDDPEFRYLPFAADWKTHDWLGDTPVPCSPGVCDPGRHCRVAGFRRNQQMLDRAGPDLVLAFSDLPVTPGTNDMIERTKKAGVPAYLISRP